MEPDMNPNGFIVWSRHMEEGEHSYSSDASFSIYIATPISRIKTRRFFVDVEETVLKHHVTQIIRDNVYPINQGDIFYRARINKEDNAPFEDDDLKAPPEHLVGNGRLNQKRVRYLYVADQPKTAIAEMRPWRKAVITVATAKAKEAINVIDFVPRDTDSPDSFKRIIGELFSRPVRPDISDIEYLPTQCIAEFVKRNGFGGVRYESAVNPGGINYRLGVYPTKTHPADRAWIISSEPSYHSRCFTENSGLLECQGNNP